jgi:hypothetical protein
MMLWCEWPRYFVVQLPWRGVRADCYDRRSPGLGGRPCRRQNGPQVIGPRKRQWPPVILSFSVCEGKPWGGLEYVEPGHE